MAIFEPGYSDHPAIAAAFKAIDAAATKEADGAARDQLRKAELQRDIDLGFTDLWTDWESEKARELGLI